MQFDLNRAIIFSSFTFAPSYSFLFALTEFHIKPIFNYMKTYKMNIAQLSCFPEFEVSL